MGCLVDGPALYADLTAWQNLKVQCLQRGLNEADIAPTLQLVGLKDTGSKPAGKFSLGMRQRLGLAVALLGKPEFLVLDEPLNGLDPMGIQELRHLLEKLNREQGMTILLSSHILSELHQLATSYGILHNGQLLEQLTAEELEAAITPKTKMLVMPFPNNPTGSIMTKEDLEPIAEVVKRHDLYVLSDEIYSELTYKTEHVSIASLPGMQERTLVINGFSKGFAMTGWRLGYICGPSVIIEQMLKIHQFAIMCAPTNSQYAAIEGLRHCEDEVQQMRNAYNQRRRYLVNEFAKMKLECFEPFGAFYIFPSIKEFGMTSEEFAMRFLEEEKVAVVPGSAFGESGEGFLRVSYAYSLEDLKEAIGRLSRFVERLRSQK